MKDLTVKQLAAISGVTVRTLHHYDEIGLLRPASVGANGYRYYGRAELLRLQRILFHRELGVPLQEIAALLELEGADQVRILQQHRAKLQAERERYRVLIETIDRTIHDLKGEATMANEDLYKGFSAEKQSGYEAWLIEKYGPQVHSGIERAKQMWMNRSSADQKKHLEASMKELKDLEQALADALRNHVDVGSDAVGLLIDRHRAWVASMWGTTCSAQSYCGLADLYLAHPDFMARYESIEKGFAQYLSAAMKRRAARWNEPLDGAAP
ncbi:MAG: MerR family transcriptional regulator [Pseudomonadota bacterium]